MRKRMAMVGVALWGAGAWAHGLPFSIVDSRLGYHRVAEFGEFLSAAAEGAVAAQANPYEAMAYAMSPWVACLAILLGGLLLNLTPCVLPMIPVNLMIIGAGTMEEGGRAKRFSWRGLRLGGLYGAGIAVAYGALGVVSALTGAAFGWVQSMAWFNVAMAVFFVALALAMLDVFSFSLERLGNVGRKTLSRWWAVMGMGAVSALLAGHCVAPVLVYTLLWSANLYAQGNVWGAFLPFLLGLGMALPWPIAGAGLAIMPKPGRWMVWAKRLFAVAMLGMAAYYAYTAIQAYAKGRPVAGGLCAEAGCVAWQHELDNALVRSLETGKPVFVDLWATWCPACRQMEATTLKDKAIHQRLEQDFIVLKLECASFKDPDTLALLDAMKAPGLPAYVILRPHGSP
ncbi:MAG: thioredoxin family protein [Kiritimatiellaeota bacterium]|nr:thioredoxin family protein [Kiritimatiellota bacterium]